MFNLQEREREPDDGEGVVFSLENLNLKTEHERGTRSRSRRVFLLVVLFSQSTCRGGPVDVTLLIIIIFIFK